MNLASKLEKLEREIIPDLNNISRAIDDEDDRSYFGSTNDADSLREIAEWLDDALRNSSAVVSELLEALQDVIGGCTVLQPNHMPNAVKRARAAISKATGDVA